MNCSSLALRVLGAGLFVMSFLCLGPGAARAEVAAHADFIHGLVTAAEPNQAGRTLRKGAEIFDHDQIDTAQGARAQLRFSDGGLVSLLPNTTFSVEEYRLGDAGGEDGALVFGLLRGGLRTITGAIGQRKHDNYQLKTPVGTLGIRGTEFIAVIDPPGTLRVHVGRGKVVLSNQYGTLEVPEGYDAIMTADEAPRLTEQGPVFMATGPAGDLGVPVGMVRSNPYNLDLPLMASLDAASEPFLTSGPGYYMSVIRIDPINVTPQSVSGGPGAATFNAGNGALSSFAMGLGAMDLGGPGAAAAVSQSTVAGLNWGVLSNGSMTLSNVSYTYTSNALNPPERYLPYIIGALTTGPLTGTLSFSLPAGVTPSAYANTGDIGTLTQFDLGINLGAVPTPTYTLAMSLDMNTLGRTYSLTNGSGNLNPSLAPGTFGFYNGQVTGSGGACGGPCDLNVSGFVTAGGSAGVTYSLKDNTELITGVAPLVPPSYTPPPVPGGGGGVDLGI